MDYRSVYRRVQDILAKQRISGFRKYSTQDVMSMIVSGLESTTGDIPIQNVNNILGAIGQEFRTFRRSVDKLFDLQGVHHLNIFGGRNEVADFLAQIPEASRNAESIALIRSMRMHRADLSGPQRVQDYIDEVLSRYRSRARIVERPQQLDLFGFGSGVSPPAGVSRRLGLRPPEPEEALPTRQPKQLILPLPGLESKPPLELAREFDQEEDFYKSLNILRARLGEAQADDRFLKSSRRIGSMSPEDLRSLFFHPEELGLEATETTLEQIHYATRRQALLDAFSSDQMFAKQIKALIDPSREALGVDYAGDPFGISSVLQDALSRVQTDAALANEPINARLIEIEKTVLQAKARQQLANPATEQGRATIQDQYRIIREASKERRDLFAQAKYNSSKINQVTNVLGERSPIAKEVLERGPLPGLLGTFSGQIKDSMRDEVLVARLIEQTTDPEELKALQVVADSFKAAKTYKMNQGRMRINQNFARLIASGQLPIGEEAAAQSSFVLGGRPTSALGLTGTRVRATGLVVNPEILGEQRFLPDTAFGKTYENEIAKILQVQERLGFEAFTGQELRAGLAGASTYEESISIIGEINDFLKDNVGDYADIRGRLKALETSHLTKQGKALAARKLNVRKPTIPSVELTAENLLSESTLSKMSFRMRSTLYPKYTEENTLRVFGRLARMPSKGFGVDPATSGALEAYSSIAGKITRQLEEAFSFSRVRAMRAGAGGPVEAALAMATQSFQIGDLTDANATFIRRIMGEVGGRETFSFTPQQIGQEILTGTMLRPGDSAAFGMGRTGYIDELRRLMTSDLENLSDIEKSIRQSILSVVPDFEKTTTNLNWYQGAQVRGVIGRALDALDVEMPRSNEQLQNTVRFIEKALESQRREGQRQVASGLGQFGRTTSGTSGQKSAIPEMGSSVERQVEFMDVYGRTQNQIERMKQLISENERQLRAASTPEEQAKRQNQLLRLQAKLRKKEEQFQNMQVQVMDQESLQAYRAKQQELLAAESSVESAISPAEREALEGERLRIQSELDDMFRQIDQSLDPREALLLRQNVLGQLQDLGLVRQDLVGDLQSYMLKVNDGAVNPFLGTREQVLSNLARAQMDQAEFMFSVGDQMSPVPVQITEVRTLEGDLDRIGVGYRVVGTENRMRALKATYGDRLRQQAMSQLGEGASEDAIQEAINQLAQDEVAAGYAGGFIEFKSGTIAPLPADMTLDQLRARAKHLGVKRVGSMKRETLLARIDEATSSQESIIRAVRRTAVQDINDPRVLRFPSTTGTVTFRQAGSVLTDAEVAQLIEENPGIVDSLQQSISEISGTVRIFEPTNDISDLSRRTVSLRYLTGQTGVLEEAADLSPNMVSMNRHNRNLKKIIDVLDNRENKSIFELLRTTTSTGETSAMSFMDIGSAEELSRMTTSQLRKIASQLGIKGRSKLKLKEQLIRKIDESRGLSTIESLFNQAFRERGFSFGLRDISRFFPNEGIELSSNNAVEAVEGIINNLSPEGISILPRVSQGRVVLPSPVSARTQFGNVQGEIGNVAELLMQSYLEKNPETLELGFDPIGITVGKKTLSAAETLVESVSNYLNAIMSNETLWSELGRIENGKQLQTSIIENMAALGIDLDNVPEHISRHIANAANALENTAENIGDDAARAAGRARAAAEAISNGGMRPEALPTARKLLQDASRLIKEDKMVRYGAYGAAAVLSAGLARALLGRNREDITKEELAGPTNLPGGNPYSGVLAPGATYSAMGIPGYRSNSASFENGGVTYQVNARGDYDPALIQSQIEAITQSRASGTISRGIINNQLDYDDFADEI